MADGFRKSLTHDELARVQEAVGEAFYEWHDEHEDAVEFDPPVGHPFTDYPSHHVVVSASDRQTADLFDRIEAAATGATA